MKEKQIAINELIERKSFINNASIQYLLIKRLFDIVISILAMLLLSSIFLITFIWIKTRLRGAVLYTEEKYGLMGIRFHTFEFTKIIKNTIIRKLPLLFNIFKGNMSFVGPQPSSTEDVTHVAWYNLRLSAKPGLTGLWQVSGKTGGVHEKVRMDLKYIRERSLRVDLKILLKAIYLMLAKKEVLSLNDGNLKD